LAVWVRKKVSWGDIFWKTTRWIEVLPDLGKIREGGVLGQAEKQNIH
jgi:hypothetical protein